MTQYPLHRVALMHPVTHGGVNGISMGSMPGNCLSHAGASRPYESPIVDSDDALRLPVCSRLLWRTVRNHL